MTITSFLSLNGQELTEQGRTISDSIVLNASDIELDEGMRKRYVKDSKRKFSFRWEYLPSLQAHTIDNRKARDYIKNLALTTRTKILMLIKLDPLKPAESIYVFVEDYSEDLIRRDITTGCDYYSVSLSVEEA
jgi:hypothetical protein